MAPQEALNRLLRLQSRTEPGDRQTTLKNIAEVAAELLSADLTLLYPVSSVADFEDPTSHLFDAPVVVGQERKPLLKPRWKTRSNGVTHALLKSGILAVEDLDTRPELKNPYTDKEDIAAFLGVMIHVGQGRDMEPLGVLYFNYRRNRKFSESETNLIGAFVNSVAPILQRDLRLWRYQKVAELGQKINSKLGTVNQLFDDLCGEIQPILDARHFLALGVYQPQFDRFKIHYQSRSVGCFTRKKLPKGLFRKALFEDKSPLVGGLNDVTGNARQNDLCLGSPGVPNASWMFVPLIFRGTPLGVLSIQSPKPSAFRDQDLRILALLGNHIAMALNTIRLFKNLEDLNQIGKTLTKGLTKLNVLENIAKKIKNVTRSDLVFIFPFRHEENSFESPISAGKLLEPGHKRSGKPTPDDLAVLALKLTKPEYAEDSKTLFDKVSGNKKRRFGNFELREQIRSSVVICLRVGVEPVGVLFINYRQSMTFDAPQRQIIEGLASYSGIAIKNSREYGDLENLRISELNILMKIDKALSRTLNLGQIFETLIDESMIYVNTDVASVLQYNKAKDRLEFQYVRGIKNPPKVITSEKSIVNYVRETREIVRVDDVKNHPKFKHYYLNLHPETVSELCLPLHDGEEVLGVINFESTTPFKEKDELFLNTLSGQAVLAIKNAQRHEQSQRVAKEREALIEVSKKLTVERDDERILELILKRALEITNSQSGNLMKIDPETQKLYEAHSAGKTMAADSAQKVGEGVVGWVAENKKPWNCGDVNDPESLPTGVQYVPYFKNIQSEIAVPILDSEKKNTIGIINIENEEARHFTDLDRELLEALSDLAAIVIKNSENFRSLNKERFKLNELNRVVKKIIEQVENYDEVMKIIVRSAMELTNADFAELDLIDNGKRIKTFLIDQIRNGKGSKEVTVEQFKPDDSFEWGIIKRVVETQKPYKTGSTDKDRYYRGDAQILSEVALPLSDEGEGVFHGVLDVERIKRDAFDEEDIKVLDLLKDVAVVAIQNMQNFLAAKEENRRFGILYQVSRKLANISEESELKEAYSIITDSIGNTFGCSAVIRRYLPLRQTLVKVHYTSHQDAPLNEEQPLSKPSVNANAFNREEVVVVDDISSPPDGVVPDPSDPTTQTLIAVPLLLESKVCFGTLALGSPTIYFFREHRIELLKGLAKQLAVTIHRLEVAKRVHESEKMATVGKVSFDMTHRLGNQLGFIPTWLKRIRKRITHHQIADSVISNSIDEIENQVRRVIRESVKIKKIFGETAKIGQFRTTIPVGVMIEENIRGIVHGDNITISPTFSKGCEKIPLDERVKMILNNLLTNAVEAMPKGGNIEIQVEKNSHFLKLRVSDQGVGIPEENLGKVFNFAFSTKESSGYGLWSSLETANAIGGDLQLESTSANGTVFALILPKSTAEGRHGGG